MSHKLKSCMEFIYSSLNSTVSNSFIWVSIVCLSVSLGNFET